jgi:hypothetical protein
MTLSEQAQRNIDLSFEVIRQALLQPEQMDEIDQLGPDATLVFLDPADDALTAANTDMASRLEARGESVVRAEVQRRLFLQPRL